MDDREVVATIAAASPADIAVAYGKYAAALYAYCQWMLQEPTDAAEALRDTFVVAGTTIGDLTEVARLRPRLYAMARHECQRRFHVAELRDRGHRLTTDQSAKADVLPDIRGNLEPGELVLLIRSILAELSPYEREVIELSLRHDLHDADLAEVLGVSRSRAYALTARARGRLERSLGALLIARTGRETCQVLNRLLADWDGRMTEQARDLIAWHVEQCQTCTQHRQGSLRSAALSGLLPLAPLPPELQEQVLRLCSSSAGDAVEHRRYVAGPTESVPRARAPRTIRLVTWASLQSNPVVATVAVVVVVWVVAAATASVLSLAGAHPARALAAQPSVAPPSSSPAAVAITATTSATASQASARPSRTMGQAPAVLPSPVDSSLIVAGSSPSRSAKPPESPSPSPSKSPSPSPSSSRTASPSPSPSRSASPTPSRTS